MAACYSSDASNVTAPHVYSACEIVKQKGNTISRSIPEIYEKTIVPDLRTCMYRTTLKHALQRQVKVYR